MAEAGLDKRSIYERLFNARWRSAGRPKATSGGAWRLFDSEGLDPVIVDVARRRAYAVVHQEQRDRLNEVFKVEVRVLQDRGVDQVLADTRRPEKIVATEEASDGEEG